MPREENYYRKAANDLLNAVANSLCRVCRDPEKARHEINYDDPLRCPCRCEKVEVILRQAESLLRDVGK